MWTLVWILVIMAVVEVSFVIVMTTIWTLDDLREYRKQR